MLIKIISGGQTGIDRMALEVAKSLGFPTGGWAPANWWTELGSDPTLAEFGLIQAPTSDYPTRTRMNVQEAEATIVYGVTSTPGCRSTIRACKVFGKDYICNPNSESCVEFIKRNGYKILNIAGNRRSKMNAGDLFRYQYLFTETLKRLSAMP